MSPKNSAQMSLQSTSASSKAVNGSVEWERASMKENIKALINSKEVSVAAPRQKVVS